MVTAKSFFTEDQQQQIVEKIKRAEDVTSAEIRVHLESNCQKDALKRAKEIFLKIGMHKTRLKNAILIYLCIEHKKFAIIGDVGINKIVPSNFWTELTNAMEDSFKKTSFLEGILFAIDYIGKELKKVLPITDRDINELPDKISY